MRDNFLIHENYVRDKVESSPLEKFIKQNKFPWKFIIYTGLLIFTTIQALNSTKMVSDYQQPLLAAFKNSLLNLTEQHFHKTFYTLDAFHEHLNGVTDAIEGLSDSFLSQVDISEAKYAFDVYYKDYPLVDKAKGYYNVSGVSHPNFNSQKYSFAIENITEGIVQPFNCESLDETRDFVQKISSIKFKINNLYTTSELAASQRLCHNWTISINYNLAGMSRIIAYMDAHPKYCSNAYEPPSNQKAEEKEESSETSSETKEGEKGAAEGLSATQDFSWHTQTSKAVLSTHAPFGNTLNILHFIVLGLALASFVYWWYYVYEMGLLRMTSRHAKHMNSPLFYNDIVNKSANLTEALWENMGFMQKIQFFDTFFYINMIGNVFQIFGSVVAIYQNFVQADSNALMSVKEACIGFGCTSCWIYLIKFFTYDKQFAETTRVLKNSTAETFKFFIGILPVFLAFAFLGRCLFWKYEKFENLQHTIVALAAIMAGDVLKETYTDTSPEGILSVVYISIWIVLFMSVVHNVFISIISSGFKNRYLEERYQQLFDTYSLGDKGEVSKWGLTDKEAMAENLAKEPKREEKGLDWLSSVRRDGGADDYKPEGRERIKQAEIEKNHVRSTVLESTEQVEAILANMKDTVDEFCSLTKDKEEKTAVRKSFLKCLKDLHLHTVNELSNAKASSPKKVLKRAMTEMEKLDLNETTNSKEKEE